jgi:CCR4-NOT transcriptional regulation complex NOT5 subunit
MPVGFLQVPDSKKAASKGVAKAVTMTATAISSCQTIRNPESGRITSWGHSFCSTNSFEPALMSRYSSRPFTVDWSTIAGPKTLTLMLSRNSELCCRKRKSAE